MGGSASTGNNQIIQHANVNGPPSKEKINEIVKFILPLYYTKVPFEAGELELGEKSWKLILNNQSVYFNELKKSNPKMDPQQSCVDYFFDVLYTRLFDVHPNCRGLFQRPIHKQGSFFGRMFSLLFAEIQEPEKFSKSLQNLTHVHNKIGVKAFEYCLMGEVIIYSLKKVLSPEVYTQKVHLAWVKFYSRILDGIIPLVVEYELNHEQSANDIKNKRLINQASNIAPVFTMNHTLRPVEST